MKERRIQPITVGTTEPGSVSKLSTASEKLVLQEKGNRRRQFFYFCGHEQFQPEELVEHAKVAENSGFDGILTSEHFNPWVADVGASGFTFATLGAIAAKTREIQLMTGVITPLFRYHPAVIAQAAATVDRLSDGRFLLGVGTGEPLNEVPLGYKFPKYKERAERMREALQIIRALFDGEKLTYGGNYYSTEDCKLYSPPKGSIPIYLAASGPKSARLAGEYADGIIISVKKPEDAQINVLKPAREEASKRDRDLKVLATRWTIFAKSDEEAWEALKPWRGLRVSHRSTISNPEKLQQEADSLPHDEILSKYTIVSSMEAYVDAYKPLITTLDADIVVFQTTSTDQKKLIRNLGKEVLPVLRNL